MLARELPHPPRRAPTRLALCLFSCAAAMAGDATASAGSDFSAHGWRVSGAARPTDVRYSGDGEWVGLDRRVGGGWRLSYRLP